MVLDSLLHLEFWIIEIKIVFLIFMTSVLRFLKKLTFSLVCEGKLPQLQIFLFQVFISKSCSINLKCWSFLWWHRFISPYSFYIFFFSPWPFVLKFVKIIRCMLLWRRLVIYFADHWETIFLMFLFVLLTLLQSFFNGFLLQTLISLLRRI